MSIIESGFAPPAIMGNPHLQTILASKVFKPAEHPTRSERVELPDGDYLDLEFSLKEQGDIVAVFHGLAGCIRSPYIQGSFNTLSSSGFRPVLMHWRGCGGEPNRLARAYHSGASDDIAWFVNYLRKRFPRSRLFALGFSLGANALLKYLGESGTNSRLTGAIAVSPPLVLAEGANQLNRGFARVYQRYLLGLLRAQHEKKRRSYPSLGLPVAGPELNSFWKFDDALTAPLHGYKDVHDYYTKCSARPYLQSIVTPTHILSARDDPFFTADIFPDASELSTHTTLELAQKGGHVGFLDQRGRWLDKHVATTMSGLRQSLV